MIAVRASMRRAIHHGTMSNTAMPLASTGMRNAVSEGGMPAAKNSRSQAFNGGEFAVWS
jgi:hypothetical protein